MLNFIKFRLKNISKKPLVPVQGISRIYYQFPPKEQKKVDALLDAYNREESRLQQKAENYWKTLFFGPG